MLNLEHCADYLEQVRAFADAMDAKLAEIRAANPEPELKPLRKAYLELHPERIPKPYSARAQLEERLDYLATYGGTPDYTTCSLFKDWAPQSFEFLVEKDGKPWFNGGLIYHGPQLDGSVVDPLSIELTSGEGPHWSIHT